MKFYRFVECLSDDEREMLWDAMASYRSYEIENKAAAAAFQKQQANERQTNLDLLIWEFDIGRKNGRIKISIAELIALIANQGKVAAIKALHANSNYSLRDAKDIIDEHPLFRHVTRNYLPC